MHVQLRTLLARVIRFPQSQPSVALVILQPVIYQLGSLVCGILFNNCTHLVWYGNILHDEAKGALSFYFYKNKDHLHAVKQPWKSAEPDCI